MPDAEPLVDDSRLPRPLAELHLHLEGTLEPDMIFELAARNGLTLPYRDQDDLAARYRFTDLQSFLDLYYANIATLTTQYDFEELAWRYLCRAHAAGVKHAEVFVDPQAHLVRGVAAATVLQGVQQALERARHELDMTGGIIVCVLRDHPVHEAKRMLDAAMESGVELLGIGLDSAEVGHPPSDFAGVFADAAAARLRRVCHAGEEGPAEYIWEALDVLGAERIDHGIRCLDDPALVRRLAAERTPLTVCPLSNVRLRVVERLTDHPLPRMLDSGLIVSVNSDDPAYFGGYVDDNLRACRRELGLTTAQLHTLAENSVRASFLSEERRQLLLAELAARGGFPS